MRIAQVAPLHESVPPRLYGGTERVVSYLTEELVRQGHLVTLFASGDSHTAARLAACCKQGLRLSGCPDTNIPHLIMLEQVMARADQFDIIHFHTDCLHLPLARRVAAPVVTTLHGRLDLPHIDQLYREFSDMPLVSISDNQRRPIPWANWAGTVHHGLPAGLLAFRERPDGYLVFTGRIAPEKRPDRAIEIARRAGLPLRIAAKVSHTDQPYFDQVIRPLLRTRGVEFLGEVDDQAKAQLLGGAVAMLFPIDWPEPFGMVMIEAMACGTPTIAFGCGSVPEVIEPGRSGLIVDSVEEAVAAVPLAADIDRAGCRQCFERRFTVRRMADDYLAVYRRCVRGRAAGRAEVRGRSRIESGRSGTSIRRRAARSAAAGPGAARGGAHG